MLCHCSQIPCWDCVWFLVSAVSYKKNNLEKKSKSFITYRHEGAETLDSSSWVINREAYSVNSSTYWGFVGAEINAVAYGAGAVRIKPLSAVPGLRKGMRSYSSHRPKGSCQLCPSGGCCLEKFPKGVRALLFCLLLSSQLPPAAQAEKTQTFSFSGPLAVTRFRWRGKCQCYPLNSQCQLYDAVINCNFTDKMKTCVSKVCQWWE